MQVQELIVYRNFSKFPVFKNMDCLLGDMENKERELSLYDLVHTILETADECGFFGNLWQCYWAYMLACDENMYSTSCEMRGTVGGSLNEAALHDFEIIKTYYDVDILALSKKPGMKTLCLLDNYEAPQSPRKAFDESIRNRICDLAISLGKSQSAGAFKDRLTSFYKEYGVGKFGLHKAFRIRELGKKPIITAITDVATVHLDDLVGYSLAKKQLTDNTRAFVEGKKANNCLLYGEAGTGKSTCVRALLHHYAGQGLRMIELYKHQFSYLGDVLAEIKNRNYKFILYMDDLSFEDFEIEYKYLKSLMEGGLEKRPDNVLLYASSNRRHLIREVFRDRQGLQGDVHATETMQEKFSLSDRFGELVFFDGPSRKEFQKIVTVLAKRNGIDMAEEDLLLACNQWEMSHGSKSGRTAQQFIDHLLGTLS